MNSTLSQLGAALTAAGLALAISTGRSLAQDVTLKLHQMLPEQAVVPSKVLIPWMAKIEQESGGRIKFEHYPAMQLGGKPAEFMDQVADGVADVVWTLPG
jgi:TRAP-type C4-dicarboxylate transport system substrate-binding protein